MTVTNPAETYERYMVPVLFAPWADRLVELAAPRPGEHVLDVACGTGIVARRIAPAVGAGGTVVGLDISPDMLDVARSTAVDAGLDIEWRQGAAEALEFPDGAFHLVVCQFALMFFDDRNAALAEMYRVLEPGGRAVIAVWQGLDRHPFYRTLDEVIQRRLGMSGIGDIFGLGDTGELRALMERAGFRDVRIEQASMPARFPEPELFLAGEIDVDTAAIPAMQRLDPGQRQEIVAAIRDDMEHPLREVTEGNEVVLPFHANLVVGSR
jgi:ubiquinone/menaquinone biosynthesis C-methylase UbiE